MEEKVINISACRSLVSSILEQAFVDALKVRNSLQWTSAVRFIDPENKLFCTYCWLIDLDPVYVAEKMKHKIKRMINAKRMRGVEWITNQRIL